jgi:acyl-coenzyme A thioesterase PaaI-like protein
MSPAWKRFKQTLSIRALGWWKIPLIALVSPSVVELEGDRCVIRIPLRRRTRNHLGSMYFGALSIGADIAGGLLAVQLIRAERAKVSLAFKSFRADFLKRPESDVYFVCEEGARIRALVERTLASAERHTEPIALRAEVRPANGPAETVAEFVLELSLKRSDKGAI